MGSDVTRRGFLAGAALAAAGVAAGGLAGCSSESSKGATSEPSAPASAGVPASWDVEYEVIVVGGGVIESCIK